MKKKLVQLTAILMSSMLVIGGLSGCNKKPTTSEQISTVASEIEEVEPDTTLSYGKKVKLLDIKNKYGVADQEQIKPFYNVDQQTEFVFHFKNTEIEPCYAVTVHTDPKCELNSTVYQLNDGYLTGNGLDVVVKPGLPVLNETQKYENYNWGNAPIYYLAIRYDMESTEIKPLDEPIIVPFTIYNEISTPNAEANIKSDGTFELTWKPVTGATKYNIYEAQKVKSWGAEKYTRAECGYVGDHLTLLTSVDGNTTSFTDFKLDGSNNTQESIDGYIQNQNFYELGSYYISAVDASGNESQLSMAICGWKYENQLPYNFDKYNSLNKEGTSSTPLTVFPTAVDVTMVDKTTTKFPINFTKVSEPKDEYENAVYEYNIVGTKLTGTVYYDSETDTYPDTVTSPINVQQDIFTIKNDINIIPENTVGTIPSSTKDIDLSKKAEYPEDQKIPMNQDTRYKRADIESARIIADGIYVNDTPFTIGSYIDGGKQQTYTAPEHVETEPEGLPTNSAEPSSEEPKEETPTVETPSDNPVVEEPVSEPISEEKPVVEEPSEEPKSEVTEPVSEEPKSEVTEPVSEEPSEEKPTENTEEITSKELVDEQMETTKEEVEEANEIEIDVAGYPVFADSAEEEYLATCMINCDESISISAFPSLANTEYLADVLLKVIRQNPYVVGVQGFDFDGTNIYPEYLFSKEETQKKQSESYNESKNIVSSVVTSSMTDEEKILAIWKYLEDNTEYDHAALDAAEGTNFETMPAGHEDAFNIYGIMCKKVGVCQSYSYVYKALLAEAGVPCVSLVGCCQKTLPHAWNAVKLGGSWYWIDVTNNGHNIGIPYYLYQTSSDFAENNDYVLWDEFDLNNNLSYVINSDQSKDFYVSKGLIADTSSDLPRTMVNAYKAGPISYDGKRLLAVRYNGATITQDDLMAIAKALMAEGMSESDVMNCQLGQSSKYVMFMY